MEDVEYSSHRLELRQELPNNIRANLIRILRCYVRIDVVSQELSWARPCELEYPPLENQWREHEIRLFEWNEKVLWDLPHHIVLLEGSRQPGLRWILHPRTT